MVLHFLEWAKVIYFCKDEENSSAQEDAEEEDGYLVSKERKTSIPQKKKVQEAPKSCFAALTSQNIKLIYLKRTLLQSLLKSDESFEDKVVGSFVRIKSDPNDFLQKNSHQLQQVTGVKKTFGSGDAGLETYLQLSNWTKDVLISSLSEDDFSEAECEDLRERVKAGLLKRLTVVELELKAHDLHEDITKHWIDKEIKMLQRRIDHANEKGWRRELYEYLQKRQLLMTKSEQERLLSEKPKVVAEELEPEATKAGASERDEEKSGSPEPEQTRLFGENLKVEAKEPEKETMPLDAPEEPEKETMLLDAPEEPEKETMPLDAPEKPEKETMPLDAPEKPEKETMPPLDASKEVGAVKCFSGSTLRGPSDLLAAGMALSLQVATSPTRNLYSSFKEAAKESVVIELSDDDEDGDIANGNQLVSPCPRPVDEKVWYYMDPQGVVQGPFTLIQLREWYAYSYFHPKFCVWKAGQGPQQPVLLVDVLRRYSMI
ncbi:uncharacterized protein At5g08430 isoform X2 [Ipomoea triloba]|uniref:uncharacterized protein At5g08430 isoform X2 n=1 Tax=Ipomoea triloba TaxID=35885 RepID=UPI00125CEBFE|nr:uncharacterized protein At5g08430 isoform X2 [Ipomoea triloba]